MFDVINENHSNCSFNINSLTIGASISCSGICLTLKKVLNNTLFFDVSDETREKTNFSTWNSGTLLNLEKSGVHLAHIKLKKCFVELFTKD